MYLAGIFFPYLPLDVHFEFDVLLVPKAQHFLFELAQPLDRRFDDLKRAGRVIFGRLSDASAQMNQPTV